MALATYSLIIAVDCDPSQLINLSDLAWDQQIPLIKVHSCGFYGAIRVQINELPSKLRAVKVDELHSLILTLSRSRRDAPRILGRPARPRAVPSARAICGDV